VLVSAATHREVRRLFRFRPGRRSWHAFGAATPVVRQGDVMTNEHDRDGQDDDEAVALHSYDPAWPARFQSEAGMLTEALGPWITGGVHHVGSTAIPGLAAKPVIDIMVGVADLDSSRQCIDLLAELDYCYAPHRADEGDRGEQVALGRFGGGHAVQDVRQTRAPVVGHAELLDRFRTALTDHGARIWSCPGNDRFTNKINRYG
jgi:GrpB-like predicted nucleotidyltransferase (UPF0157 family)